MELFHLIELESTRSQKVVAFLQRWIIILIMAVTTVLCRGTRFCLSLHIKCPLKENCRIPEPSCNSSTGFFWRLFIPLEVVIWENKNTYLTIVVVTFRNRRNTESEDWGNTDKHSFSQNPGKWSERILLCPVCTLIK